MVFFQKTLPHASILPDLILRCIRKFEVWNQIISFPMVSNLHIQPPFFVLNCLQIRIKGLSPSSFTTTSASFHSPQMSQPHMLYFCRRTFPPKYCVCRKCLHLQFTTYHICRWGLGGVGTVIVKNIFSILRYRHTGVCFLLSAAVSPPSGGNFIIQFPNLFFGLFFNRIKAFHNLHKLVI